MSFLLVFSTVSTMAEARKMAKVLIRKRIAACVSLHPGFESHYRWEGKEQKAKEVLLLIKTSKAKYALLEKEIKRLHSYSVPEILAIRPVDGNRDYLKWMTQAVK